jgi:hypothetical protein
MTARIVPDIIFSPMPQVVAQAFFTAAERIRDMQAPMEAAARIVSEEIAANFEAQGRPGKWPELADSTIRKKAGQGLDPRILHATLALYAGASGEGYGGLGSWDIAQTGTAWTAILEDPTGYGFFHLEGTKFMPVRDWAFIPDDAYDEVDQVFLEWLHEATAPIGAV